MHWDFSEVMETEDFASLPQGWHTVRIEEVREGRTRDGDERWGLKLVVDGGRFAGRVAAWDGLVWSERGSLRAKRLLEALGFEISGVLVLEPSELVGRTLDVELVLEEPQEEHACADLAGGTCPRTGGGRSGRGDRRRRARSRGRSGRLGPLRRARRSALPIGRPGPHVGPADRSAPLTCRRRRGEAPAAARTRWGLWASRPRATHSLAGESTPPTSRPRPAVALPDGERHGGRRHRGWGGLRR